VAPSSNGGCRCRAAVHNGVYALLADGSTVEIRPAAAGDADAVREMHRAMSPGHVYLRFFSVSPAAAEMEARRICREPGPDHAALLAWLAGDLVGVASYETSGAARRAEIAFAVADHAHHRGVATLLLEHLVSAARARGVRTFAADVLTENSAMLQVFAAAGLQARRTQVDGVTELTFDLPAETDSAAGMPGACTCWTRRPATPAAWRARRPACPSRWTSCWCACPGLPS